MAHGQVESWRARTAVLATFTLLVAACGGDAPEAGDASQPDAVAEAPVASSFDPCTLLTAEEVTAAVGWQPVKTERFGGQEGRGTCSYTGPEGATFSMTGAAPQQVKVGILMCFTNFPCDELPDFATSAAMAQYRLEQYPKEGAYADLDPAVTPLDGLGVPAIEHELAGLRDIEMWLGDQKLAYVETWASSEITRALAEKALSRAR